MLEFLGTDAGHVVFPQNKCNVGYAFINMTDPQHIIPFYKVDLHTDLTILTIFLNIALYSAFRMHFYVCLACIL